MILVRIIICFLFLGLKHLFGFDIGEVEPFLKEGWFLVLVLGDEGVRKKGCC